METPSNCQIGETVDLNFYDSGMIKDCIVDAVKFEEDSVYYDISICVNKEDSYYTLIKGVSASFVFKK